MQGEQLQAHGEAVEPEARPGDHAVLLECIVVHNLEPRKVKWIRQPKSRVGFFHERLWRMHGQDCVLALCMPLPMAMSRAGSSR